MHDHVKSTSWHVRLYLIGGIATQESPVYKQERN